MDLDVQVQDGSRFFWDCSTLLHSEWPIHHRGEKLGENQAKLIWHVPFVWLEISKYNVKM